MAMTLEPTLTRSATTSPVSSYTEWDTLEEVVVGSIDRSVVPTWQDSMRATMPTQSWPLFRHFGGRPFPAELVDAAARELDGLCARLEREGVSVVRPDPIDFQAEHVAPTWRSKGLYAAMPRDLLLVVGETIIEAPLSWRCRYHEVEAFRPLIKDYFQRGASWLPAPRPELTDELFATDHDPESAGGYAVTEFEPVFDAADFMRFGRDIVVQQSHVTNQFGIEWLQRALGDGFTVHCIDVDDPHAMHIDATLIPLAPGKLLVNGERFLPSKLFSEWEIRQAPPPSLPADWPMFFCSPWVSMNLLSLDEHTVLVERNETETIEALRSWNLECIPVDFRHVYTFGGSFHCVTLDVRRQGSWEIYL